MRARRQSPRLTRARYSCVVYDFGSRDKKRGVPRALWYGTEFVRYALDWYWFDAKDDTQTPILR